MGHVYSRRLNWLAVTAVGVAAAALAGAAEQPVLLDGIAARVNDHVILVGDVLKEAQPEIAAARRSGRTEGLEDRLKQIYRAARTNLIEAELIYAAYQKEKAAKKVDVPDQVLNEKIDGIIRDRFGDDREAFLEALRKEGLTLDGWRENVRKRLLISMMTRREVESRVAVTPGMVQAEYEGRRETYLVPERVQMRMIVVRSADAGSADAARAKAQDIRKRLLAGEDFAAAAKELAGDRPDGEPKWFPIPDLNRDLSALATSLKPGNIGGIVEIEGDFYLVKLEAREAASLRPFDAVRSELERALRKSEYERLYKAWIERLKKNAYVAISDQAFPA